MKTIVEKIILAAALCALAAPVFADDTMTTNPPPAATMMTPADFVWDAALINLKEIRLGEAAQTNSQNEAVQKFGKHMIREHTKNYDKLVKIADAEGLQLPDTNLFCQTVTVPPEKQATELLPETPQDKMVAAQLAVQNLTALSGPQFDNAYADAMVKGHEKAIEKFEDAASSLQDEQLQKYAQKSLPTIRHHLEMAQKLQSDLMQNPNGTGSSPMTNSMPTM